MCHQHLFKYSTRVYGQIDSNSLMQVSFEWTCLNKFIFLGRGWRHRSSVGDESIFQLLFCHRRHPSHFSVLLQQSQQLIHKASILFQLICNSPTLHSEAPCWLTNSTATEVCGMNCKGKPIFQHPSAWKIMSTFYSTMPSANIFCCTSPTFPRTDHLALDFWGILHASRCSD